eukprot:1157556-Pelagomonas_calceolata.AAC.3
MKVHHGEQTCLGEHVCTWEGLGTKGSPLSNEAHKSLFASPSALFMLFVFSFGPRLEPPCGLFGPL